MSINQVQLRLSIDGQQALSTLDAVELRQQNLISSNKDLSDARNLAFAEYQKGLLEIVKLQEKQTMLDKQMAVASESGKLVQLTRMEAEYEANATKLEALFNAQHDYNTVVRENDIAIAENNKLIKANNKEIEALIKSEGDLLRQDAKLLAEKKAMNREIAIASNGSERQQKAFARLAEIEKELAIRSRERAKTTADDIQKIIKEQGFEKVSTQQLIDLNKYLENANKHRVDRATADAKEEIQSIKDVNKELAKRKEETAPDSDGISGFFKNFKGNLSSAVIGGAAGAMAGGLFTLATEAVIKLGDAVSATIDRIAKKSSEITAIQTTLDITRIKAKGINDALSEIDTRTSVSELNKLVEVAGDLNVPIQDIKSFVKVADEVGVVLGKDFGGAEQAVTEISKLKDEFKETRNLKIEDSLGKIGSMLKELALAGPASVSGITDFLKRAGNIPDALKPSISELAAYAAVFEEANLSSEISASSMGKILTEAANNLDVYAKQLRISKSQLKELLNEDSNKFLINLSQSLKGLDGTKLASTLKSLHLEGSESLKTIGVLTDNIEKLVEKQQSSNSVLEHGNTVRRVANDINSDEAAKIEKIGKSWDKVKASMTSWIALAVGPMINALAGINKKTDDTAEAYEKQASKVKNMEDSVIPLLQRYHDLDEAAKNGAKNSNLLIQTIAQIGKVVPEAVTQWDNYGNALKVNLGILEQTIEKEKLLQEQLKNQVKNGLAIANNALGGERAEINKKLREYTELENKLRDPSKLQAHELGRFTLERDRLRPQIPGLQKRAAEINKEIIDNKQKANDFDTEVDAPTNTGTGTKNNGVTFSNGKKGSEKSKENEAERKLKFEQEQRERMFDLQAKLAYEEDIILANAEEKKVKTVEYNAKNELKAVRRQFTDIKGIVLHEHEMSVEQKKVIQREEKLIEQKKQAEILQIREDFQKKREEQIIEHTNRTIQISQEARKFELEQNLKKATINGSSLGVFNAKSDIINFNESKDLITAQVRYQKEKESLKENKDALKILEENYGKERNAITAKYVGERDQLLAETTEKEVERTKKANIEKLRLDVDEANAKGKDPKKAQFALLDAQMNAELSVKDLTEAEKTNILRKYALERSKIEDEGLRKGAEKAISYFQDAFGAVTSIFSAELQNRTNQEQSAYDNRIRQIDAEKDRGIITSRQQAKAKMLADKEHDAAQRKLKREQFQLDKANNIASIIMNTALAVMKAAPNIPLQIATGVLGAVQLGIASSQQMPAYAIGGFPESVEQTLPIKKPTPTSILSWLNEDGQEYVVPNWQLNDPVTANLVDVIEYRRKNKIVGHEQGGFVSETGGISKQLLNPSNSNQTDFFDQLDKRFENMFSKLNETWQTPLTAHTAIGEQEIFKMEQEKNKLNQKLNDSFTNTNQSLIN